MGGLMSLTGLPDGEPWRPMKVGVAVADLFTGMYTASGLPRCITGNKPAKGTTVDMALFDTQLAMLQTSVQCAGRRQGSSDWARANPISP
jgi:crotonobetainyl-CoA:carnitine CoA-transferase CaiB-like acyl-CoA transferase